MPNPPLARRLFAVAAALAVVVLPSAQAGAAGGDVFAEGNAWCASTHPNHGTLSGFGPALDIGSPTDFLWPIYAPNAGEVEIHSEGWGGGWGNSIIWTRYDGAERIHMAHLDSFGETGPVEAGDLIGRVGSTGQSTSPHLHLSAQIDGKPATLILMGKEIHAGDCFTSPGPIPPTCRGQQATLLGGAGKDVLEGTAGDDVILGRRGKDTIEGGDGDDVICGGKGADVLVGKGGGDELAGSADDDTLRGGGGADTLRGGSGGDHLVGSGGTDELIGQGGPDTFKGGKKDDELAGGKGADHLRGGPGSDVAIFTSAKQAVTANLDRGTATGQGNDVLLGIEWLFGSLFGDHLVGDAGPNVLFGDLGNDSLKGRGGEDVADGGGGADACVAEHVTNCE
ncbi:MAG TPA: peptidoglycan DD-metalloendopeptidase family protein [Actinomycetota bacterium]|nr:peptidoglycan DD-metalloendopeptidase family protein [Actinomycetota bacterium]